jgi:hypothetical protein
MDAAAITVRLAISAPAVEVAATSVEAISIPTSSATAIWEAATEIPQTNIDADTTKAPGTGQILARISAGGLVD